MQANGHDAHVKRRDGVGPYDAVFIVALLDRRCHDTSDADPITAHIHRLRFAGFVEIGGPQCFAVLGAQGVDDSYINMGSTDFSALAEQVDSLLKEKKPKILVLFSDGGDAQAIKGFGDILKANNIDLYVVLVGTQKGAPVLDENAKPYSQKDGTIAITQRNDDLGKLAKENGGAYVVATTGKEDIQQLVNVIRSKYKNQQQGEVTVKERVEYFYYPLGLGLFFLLIAFSSLPRRREA